MRQVKLQDLALTLEMLTKSQFGLNTQLNLLKIFQKELK